MKSFPLSSHFLASELVPPAEVCAVNHASLFGAFPNYAGIGCNDLGTWPVSWMHLSKPTGHYVSRFGMRIVNSLLKKHAVMLVGNSCAPGLFFPEFIQDKGVEQFDLIPSQDCGTIVLNVRGIPNAPKKSIVFEAEPFMVLKPDPEWNNFQDYLNAMQSKYRVRAKKVLELSCNLKKTTWRGKEIPDALIDECADLLKETLRNKTIALNQDLRRILRNFRDQTGTNYHLYTYSREEKIVGFITWLKSGNKMYAMQVGYDAQVAKELHLYQRMLYDLTDIAIQEKMERINFGRTATEIKSTLGAEPEENSYVIFVQNPVFRALAYAYKKWFFRPEKYTVRHPFKS